mgnify:CR=1 FL=1
MAYADWKRAVESNDTTYLDIIVGVHARVVRAHPARSPRYLGLALTLDVVHISATNGNEFYVHLRKPERPVPIDERAFYAREPATCGRAVPVKRPAATPEGFPWWWTVRSRVRPRACDSDRHPRGRSREPDDTQAQARDPRPARPSGERRITP